MLSNHLARYYDSGWDETTVFKKRNRFACMKWQLPHPSAAPILNLVKNVRLAQTTRTLLRSVVVLGKCMFCELQFY